MPRSLARTRSTRIALLAAAIAAFAGAAGCAEDGQYVWYSSLPPEVVRKPSEYVIGVGDVLSIRVLGREEMTLHQRVRADGRIALFLIGEFEVKGKRPSEVKTELEAKLKDFIVSPNVVVNVDESQPISVVVLGEVVHPGAIQLDQDARLARALAMAGGLAEFASRSGIYVVRGEPTRMRIRFKYDRILRNADGAGDFALRQGDVVEVE